MQLCIHCPSTIQRACLMLLQSTLGTLHTIKMCFFFCCYTCQLVVKSWSCLLLLQRECMKVKLSQHIILSTLVITSSSFSLLGITDCRKKQMSVKDAYIQYVQRHLVPWVTANVLTHAFINVSFYLVCVCTACVIVRIFWPGLCLC